MGYNIAAGRLMDDPADQLFKYW